MVDNAVERPGLRDSDLSTWWPFVLIGPAVLAVRFPTTFQGATLWAGILVGVGLTVLLFLRRSEIPSTRRIALLTALVLLSLFSLIWSPDILRGLRFVALVSAGLLAYAWGTISGPPSGNSRLWLAGAGGLVMAAVGLYVFRDTKLIEGLNPDRILGMGVVALLVAAWYGPHTRRYTAVMGLVAMTVVVASGSRMATLVVAILVISAPGMRLPKRGRALLTFGLLSVLILGTMSETFQNRWFASGEGSAFDLLTLQDLDSSGRFEIWPAVAESCGSTVLGNGAGAADQFSSSSNPTFREPHNEYLRVWCDSGIPGIMLLAAFVGLAVKSATSQIRRGWGNRWAATAAAQLGAALVLFSLTDNPLTTAIPFLIPASLAMGWSNYELWMNRATDGVNRRAPGVVE